MGGERQKKVIVRFKPRGVDDPKDSKRIVMLVESKRLESMDLEDIKRMAEREAFDRGIISPWSSMKYWEPRLIKVEKNGNFKIIMSDG